MMTNDTRTCAEPATKHKSNATALVGGDARFVVLLFAVACLCCGCGSHDIDSPTKPSSPIEALVVVDASGGLASGYDLMVNTDRGKTDWLTRAPDSFLAAYPSGQQWGFVAVVLAGASAPGSRAAKDLSMYRTLQVQLKGASGGETVQVGIKDSSDPDDGTEVKKTVVLSSSWQTVTFTLSDFSSADKARVYMPLEIVFSGTTGRSVSFRDVRLLP